MSQSRKGGENAYALYASGFTLVELMAVVAVLGVLVAIAAPNFGPLMAKNKTSTQTNTFIADLNMARSEAIKRSTRVVICKTTNPNAATPACNATDADAWSTGWLIFADTNQDDTYTTAANDVLIKIRGALEPDLQLFATASASTPKPQNLLRFTRTGGSAQAAVFTLCNSGGEVERRLVTINSIGRAVLSTQAKGCA